MTSDTLGLKGHLTFKGNLRDTRYGWLRLTPAYSVHLVSELVAKADRSRSRVLDPFCGTGTTALVCAERGIPCDTTDINPFLIWLTEAKTYAYDQNDLGQFESSAASILDAVSHDWASEWVPPLHQIEKWWGTGTLHALGHAAARISDLSNSLSVKVLDLLQVAFCRTLIEQANVSFGHQSMSFKKTSKNGVLPLFSSERECVSEAWSRSVKAVGHAAKSRILEQPRALLGDARELTRLLQPDTYSIVVTSPPYPNRMSYIRELRPYMYWLGFLSDAGEAGKLDWKAIGGTWGSATSNLAKWTPPGGTSVPYPGFAAILTAIAAHSTLLARYVEKYFYDMVVHCKEVYDVVAPGGRIHYIVGNSKFYDVLVPVEQIYVALFESVGFTACDINVLRKRTSKKELFEFIVSATKPLD